MNYYVYQLRIYSCILLATCESTVNTLTHYTVSNASRYYGLLIIINVFLYSKKFQLSKELQIKRSKEQGARHTQKRYLVEHYHCEIANRNEW